jgi:predicted dehydrogenase
MPVGLVIVGVGGHLPTASEITEAGGVVRDVIDPTGASPEDVVRRATLAFADPRAQLAVIDLTPRSMQVEIAELAVRAGLSALIERPAATTGSDIERLTALDPEYRMIWERATPFVDATYLRMQDITSGGEIGEVVAVIASRSYPWAPWRSADESAGGLVLQSAGYGLDAAQLATNRRIETVRVLDTVRGAPTGGTARRAATVTAALEGGAIATVIVDYLKPTGGPWGRDEVRVLGTLGTVRVDGIARTVEVTVDDGHRIERVPAAQAGLLAAVANAIRGEWSPVTPAQLRESTMSLVTALERNRTTVGWDDEREARE